MQNSMSCHIYKVERVHHTGFLFVLHGNRTNCHQQQYESVANLNQIYLLFKSLGANM